MTDDNAPAVGDRARTFDLPTLDGRQFRLDDLRGKAFLLVFLRHAG